MGKTFSTGLLTNGIWQDASNNIGIGGSPSGSYKLEVTGTAKVSSTLLVSGAATFSGFVGINGSPATAFPLEAYINSATAYSSTSRGNVMRVYNSNTSANIFAGIELGGAGTANDGLAGLNAVVTGSGSAALTFYTRDSNTFAERMRITSAGNVGIGTNSPSYKLDIANASAQMSLTATDAAGYNEIYFRRNTSTTMAYIGVGVNAAVTAAGDDFVIQNRLSTGNLVLSTNSTERMRIGQSGQIGINSTNTSAKLNLTFGGAGANGFSMLDGDDGSNATFIDFKKANGTIIGSISRAGLTNAVTYNTTSDYRLKEDLKEINGLDKISKIKVYDFKWIGFEDRNDGVIAHELQEIMPYAVHGQKDAIDEDGNIKAQGVDYSKLVPVLVKAIQELNQQNQDLKSRLDKAGL